MKHGLPLVGSVPSLATEEDGLAQDVGPMSSSLSMPERGEPRKLRREGSRITSALRSLTNSPSGSSTREAASWPVPSPALSDKTTDRRKVFRKISIPFLRAPFGASNTVVRRIKSKSRPSLRSMERAANTPLAACNPDSSSLSPPLFNNNWNSNSNSNTASSGKSSGQTNVTTTTAKTSQDSKPSGRDSFQSEKKAATIVRHKEPETVATPDLRTPDSNLTTIQETALDLTSPSILTVERAAAAKIYLETYFNDRLSKPTPRSLRRRYLEGELYHSDNLTSAEKDIRRQMFYQQEAFHLRESRVLKAKTIGAVQGRNTSLANNYEVLKILGKGSFGVVRLVREKPNPDDARRRVRPGNRVYAMKVIRKSAMLRTSQEGHLRAERDFLVASEGSRWIVPLITSFQDAANLYLVMEYMPGGDFLGLLIRENILSEPVAKFYIAEMILCIEEAHSLRCIHRDIKPDNFLISASGHLKISDFGLAFDGHWSHDTSYYHTQRYSLVHRFRISVMGDAADRAEGLQGTIKWAQGITQTMQKHERWTPAEEGSPSTSRHEPLLSWRNRCGNRSLARSCVGTSQYMAPEEGGRQQTKRNIVNHKQTFAFPPRPMVSRRCMDLMASLIRKKEGRLSSKRYRYRESKSAPSSSSVSSRMRRGYQDWTGRAVYPQDGEDIKAHKWFRDIPWEHLHQITPPFVPRITSLEDTHYFDEEEPISDWSDSVSETSSSNSEILDANPLLGGTAAADTPFVNGLGAPLSPASTPDGRPTVPPRRHSPRKMAAMHAELSTFPQGAQTAIAQYVANPYDSARLKRIDREIEALMERNDHQSPHSGLPTHVNQQQHQQQQQFQELCERIKTFVRTYGRRERKRPRDRLLRDRNTRNTVLEVRKQTAFLGRAMGLVMVTGTVVKEEEQEDAILDLQRLLQLVRLLLEV
ncbi:protein kinase-like domain-containing protein [Xylariomycetidae sp. FL2044]|nr:protein kinase-like domain-containing protein [Xylariomycetidae sp. FL2044]